LDIKIIPKLLRQRYGLDNIDIGKHFINYKVHLKTHSAKSLNLKIRTIPNIKCKEYTLFKVERQCRNDTTSY